MADNSAIARPESYLSSILAELQNEIKDATMLSGQALGSLAWLWPIRGLFYALTKPSLLLSVRGALISSLLSSIVIFAVLLFFTFIPQTALLAFISGPLAPILALILVSAESLLVLAFLARPLFLEPALTHVFDATLRARGQGELVRVGKTRTPGIGSSAVEGTLVRPLQSFSKDGLFRYVATLPLNLVPVLGTVLFVLYNGSRGGPGWHARYFQLKGFTKTQRKKFAEQRKAAYTAFGMTALVLSFVPLIGLVFSFTNTVGAAMWAAELEARSNIIDANGPQASGSEKEKTK